MCVIRHIGNPFDQRNIHWIIEKIDEQKLIFFQNYCGVHLCPSETEGFGHYIMEAMSTKAVVITTDAPPMNEFILDKRCLISVKVSVPCNLASCYLIDLKNFENLLVDLESLTDEELVRIGENKRWTYLQKTKEFHDNLKELIKTSLVLIHN